VDLDTLLPAEPSPEQPAEPTPAADTNTTPPSPPDVAPAPGLPHQPRSPPRHPLLPVLRPRPPPRPSGRRPQPRSQHHHQPLRACPMGGLSQLLEAHLQTQCRPPPSALLQLVQCLLLMWLCPPWARSRQRRVHQLEPRRRLLCLAPGRPCRCPCRAPNIARAGGMADVSPLSGRLSTSWGRTAAP
jgi:hypothetical protein